MAQRSSQTTATTTQATTSTQSSTTATPAPRRGGKLVGHAAAIGAYSIFGFNIVVCKGLTTSGYMSANGIFMVRSVVAALIFWGLSLFCRHERVSRRDMWMIALASFFGFYLTQITFLAAIPLITPMECSVVGAMTPIYTMLIAAVALGEPLTWKKASGVAMSFAGVLFLILTGMKGGYSGSVAGLLLMVGNGLFFAIYLGVFRPLVERYSVVTFMKWIFLFAGLMALPAGLGNVMNAPYGEIPAEWYLELAYLVVMATFVAYFLIPIGQKRIRPTLVSMYSYLQPIIAIGISIAMGLERLTAAKIVAVVMVFGGVYLVSRSRAKSATHKAQ